jgi:hypothetical protein
MELKIRRKRRIERIIDEQLVCAKKCLKLEIKEEKSLKLIIETVFRYMLRGLLIR